MDNTLVRTPRDIGLTKCALYSVANSLNFFTVDSVKKYKESIVTKSTVAMDVILKIISVLGIIAILASLVALFAITEQLIAAVTLWFIIGIMMAIYCFVDYCAPEWKRLSLYEANLTLHQNLPTQVQTLIDNLQTQCCIEVLMLKDRIECFLVLPDPNMHDYYLEHWTDTIGYIPPT